MFSDSALGNFKEKFFIKAEKSFSARSVNPFTPKFEKDVLPTI